MDLFPAEQILNLHIANTAHLHISLEDFVKARHGPHFDVAALADVEYSAEFPSRSLCERDDYVVNPQLINEARYVFGAAQNFDTLNNRSLLGRIIINKALHVEIHITTESDLSSGEHTRAPSSDQQNRFLQTSTMSDTGPVLLPGMILIRNAPQDTQAKQPPKAEYRVHHYYRKRYPCDLKGLRQPCT